MNCGELTLCAFHHAPSAGSTVDPLSTSSCSKLLPQAGPRPDDPNTPELVAAAICQSRRPGEAFRGEPWDVQQGRPYSESVTQLTATEFY